MRSAVVAVGLTLLAAACGGDEIVRPSVDQIRPAIDAIETELGGPQTYFEAGANLQRVRVIVASQPGNNSDSTTATAMAYDYRDGELSGPENLGEAEGYTFPAEAVAFDPDAVFAGIDAKLDDPVINDFAVSAGSGDLVIYDATVLSDEGGMLIVRVDENGAVLNVGGL